MQQSNPDRAADASGQTAQGGAHVWFGTGQTQLTPEAHAELARLIAGAIANDQPVAMSQAHIRVQILGEEPEDQPLRGNREEVVREAVRRMLIERERDPGSVRVSFE